MKKNIYVKALSLLLAAAMLVPFISSCGTGGDEETGNTTDASSITSIVESTGAADETTADDVNDEPDTSAAPTLESWESARVYNSSGDGYATLVGDGISVVYDDELGKNILSFTGSGSYFSLPDDVWENAEEGFSVVITVRPDEDVSNDAVIFGTNLCGYSVGDTSWRDAPEISLTAGGNLTVYVGGRTINGTYTALSTYNNGGSADDKAYAEPKGHKPRYAADTSSVPTDEWTTVVITVSPDELHIYYDGTEMTLKEDTSLEGDLSSALEYLFGDYTGGEFILGEYPYTSVSGSVYSDVSDFIGDVSSLSIYSYALSSDEVSSLPDDAEYLFDFETRDLAYGDDVAVTSDLSKYMGEISLTEAEELSVSSPDGNTVVNMWYDADGAYYYSVTADGTVIIESSAIGITIRGADLSAGLSLDSSSVSSREINETYTTLTGASSTATNHCMEMSFTLSNDKGSFDFIIRVFDDGMAYRYENVTTATGNESITVTSEASEVILPANTTTWSFAINGTYEGEYIKRSYGELEALSSTLSTPMLARVGTHYVLLTEAEVFTNSEYYCASGLGTENGSASLSWTFGLARDPNNETTGELDQPGHITITSVKTVQGFSTPWRVAIISDDLDEFCTSTIVSDLNPDPDEELFADTDWIVPGRVAWSWWSEGDLQGDYDTHIEYIDFAAENGWEYVCLDAYWREFESRLSEICEYAAERGVGLFVWVNYSDIKDEAEMEELFSSWAAAGVVGIKADYFESGEMTVLQVMENAAICAAENKLMILYHGCVCPGGEYRTYPNVMTTEAVQGEENHKWSSLPTAENCLIFPFTRNILGSMDYTPIATKIVAGGMTNGFGLAMTVVYESSLQHLAYSAYGYKSYIGLSFLNNLSTTWDESILYEGSVGEYITYIRRADETWYIGTMTVSARETEVSLDFLDSGVTYYAYVYRDSEDGETLEIEALTVTSGDTLSFSLLDSGGAAVIISKTEIDTDTVYEDMNDPDYTYYEAESSSNTLSGAAVVQTSAFCSGGAKVGYVGYAGNTLTFNNVTVDEDGTYTLTVYYCSGETRSLTITVNGTDTYTLSGLNSGDYSRPASASLEITLSAGENTITLSNSSYYAPDIDRIAISE
ncbi:MAG: glycoside hydrolase family 97 catalytic domain-containing protein [Firmicutes bacterium]|nr:glycoside hydrolase family 97 catalytic domain-containing protein [Bacillota bacterium]